MLCKHDVKCILVIRSSLVPEVSGGGWVEQDGNLGDIVDIIENFSHKGKCIGLLVKCYGGKLEGRVCDCEY